MQRNKKYFLAAVLIFVSFMGAGLYNPLRIAEYHVKSDKIRGSIRVVQISDLHNQIYGDDQMKLIDSIKECDPDIIVMTGDIGDDAEPMLGSNLLLEGIKGLAPVYYVTGNHEYWADNTEEIISRITSHGVIMLNDRTDTVSLNGNVITVSGVNDPESGTYDDSFLEKLGEEAFNLLLAHRPERILSYSDYHIDLVFSGHAHGGQFAIPFVLNGFFSPNQGFFPKYAGGQYTVNGSVMIVSRGLSFNRIIPRFYNRPEIVLTVIEGE